MSDTRKYYLEVRDNVRGVLLATYEVHLGDWQDVVNFIMAGIEPHQREVLATHGSIRWLVYRKNAATGLKVMLSHGEMRHGQ